MDTNKYQRFNEYIKNIPDEKLHSEAQKEAQQNASDFAALKAALLRDACNYCGQHLSHFTERKPCFHWLLGKTNGFKKKYFPLLYAKYGFHQLDSYLRWVANSDVPIQNINDLVEERTSSKFIETTIRYNNIEWSFSCSAGDRLGHKDSHNGKMPHYHFQMKVSGNVVINYNTFHLPFNDYDEFCFAVKEGKIDRLRSRHIHGAGMQTVFESFDRQQLIGLLRRADEEEKAQFHVQTMVVADEGATISGDEIADLLEESKKTGVSMAKLLSGLKGAKVETFISPGPGVPEMAPRTKHHRGKKNESS